MKTVEFLYPEFTNIYGESYNMEYLRRSSDEIQIAETYHGDTPLFVTGACDMVYMGCMTEEKQEIALKLLRPYREDFKRRIEEGMIFLITGNSVEIFGKEISGDEVLSEEKKAIPGLGLFDFASKRFMRAGRHNSQYIGTFEGLTLLGHRSQYSMSFGNFEENFLEIERGIGMNPETKKEGLRRKNFFATYSLGPYLILNPHFTAYLLRLLGLDGSLAYEKEIMEAYEYRLKELRRTIK